MGNQFESFLDIFYWDIAYVENVTSGGQEFLKHFLKIHMIVFCKKTEWR